MHFKSALIVCAVSFLTSAWSAGLDREQLESLAKLFEGPKNGKHLVNEKQIAQFVHESFGMNYNNHDTFYEHESNEFDSLILQYLLIPLAEYNKKGSDKNQGKRLTPYEVRFFLEQFSLLTQINSQPGYLTLKQLSKAEYLKTMNDAFNAKLEQLIAEKGDEHVMNAVDFLLVILEIKPKGRGLTLKQVKDFGSLYVEDQSGTGSIDFLKCKEVFKELGISTTEDKLEQIFESDGPAGRILMNLIVAAAERNMAVKDTELRVFTLCEIFAIISDFIELDVDEDGVLSPDEYAEFVEESYNDLRTISRPIDEPKRILKKFEDNNKMMNIADYMRILYFTTLHDGICPFANKF
ncbi:uncharacterized protein LOC126839855 [Adelges cooleyi]|uniref:uncharacterized protein LOC126839855 n=1 Tax=Adelges cooleyi TaxID=133065 RepID=UPI00217FFD4C|nr:uncharacterized protein LOC126839855 [Adelges cooleyi]